MEILSVDLLDANGTIVEELPSGQSLSIRINFHAPQPVFSPIFGVTISRDDGFVCYDSSTDADRIATSVVNGLGQITLKIDRLDLTQNSYYLDVGVYERTWAYAYDFHWHVYPLRITSDRSNKGIIQPPYRWI